LKLPTSVELLNKIQVELLEPRPEPAVKKQSTESLAHATLSVLGAQQFVWCISDASFHDCHGNCGISVCHFVCNRMIHCYPSGIFHTDVYSGIEMLDNCIRRSDDID